MFMVEMKFATTWADAGWEEDGKPLLFTSLARAQRAIEEFITDASHLGHSADDFRVTAYHHGEEDHMASKKEGLHSRIERGIKHVEKKIEAAVSVVEETMDGPKLAIGDRVRSFVDYRRGQEGVIVEMEPLEGYVVRIESTLNGEPGTVDCHFHPGELERV
jgi:hypothetical protein